MTIAMVVMVVVVMAVVLGLIITLRHGACHAEDSFHVRFSLRSVVQIRLLPVRVVADLLMDYMGNLPPRPQGPPLDIQARLIAFYPPYLTSSHLTLSIAC